MIFEVMYLFYFFYTCKSVAIVVDWTSSMFRTYPDKSRDTKTYKNSTYKFLSAPQCVLSLINKQLHP